MTFAQLLEISKVIIGPLVAGGTAILISSRALHAFRAQRAIERKIDWFEKLHRQVQVLGAACSARRTDDAEKNSVLAQAALKALNELIRVSDDAWMFAGQDSYDAVYRFLVSTQAAAKSLNTTGLSADVEKSFVDGCIDLSKALASELRHELRLPLLENLKFRGALAG